MRRLLVVALAVAGALATACGGGSDGSGTTAVTSSAPGSPAAALPRVDLVAAAVEVVEAQADGPQRYFEINATAALVNVIVATDDATRAQFWLYADGTATRGDERAAQGFTFDARQALAFDPERVLASVREELPSSRLDVFAVTGGEGGTVRYTVYVTSAQGGRLAVDVAADGTVLAVDPIGS